MVRHGASYGRGELRQSGRRVTKVWYELDATVESRPCSSADELRESAESGIEHGSLRLLEGRWPALGQPVILVLANGREFEVRLTGPAPGGRAMTVDRLVRS
jgi:hypothetical protein